MDMSGMYESDPGLHRFNPKTAAPALKAAMAELTQRSGQADGELDGITLGDAYRLACSTYGGALPPYWKNWQTFNAGLQAPPAAMGDL